MKVRTTRLPGVLVVEPDVYGDERGYFLETYQAEKYRAHGIEATFVQDNHSFSRRGALRGLHVQYRRPQGKLIRVVEGAVFDVVADIRPGSPSAGRWFGLRIDGSTHHQIYVPPGYAHGFCVLSETVHFEYKCTDYYDSGGELTVAWDDPVLGIDWPIDRPTLSEKDRRGLSLAEASAFLEAPPPP